MFVRASKTSNEILSKCPTHYLKSTQTLRMVRITQLLQSGQHEVLWRSAWKGVDDGKEEWTTGRRERSDPVTTKEAVNQQKSRSKFSSMTEKFWEAVRVCGKDPSVVKAV